MILSKTECVHTLRYSREFPVRCSHCFAFQGSLAFDFSAAGNVDFGPVRFELRRSGCEQSIFSFAFHSGICIICLPAVVFARITIFSGFVVTNNIILKLTDVDRGEGAAAEGLAFSTRVSIDLIH